MKQREILFSDNRKIEIYDDVFLAKDKLNFYEFAQNSNYKLARSSTAIIEDRGLSTLKCDLTFTELLRMGFFTAKEFYPIVLKMKTEGQRLSRSYINLCTSEDIFPYHTDCADPEAKTILYYINTKWDPTWEGETHFSDESMIDILCSSSFIPGRFAVFNSTIPHKSSQPSSAAGQFRFTLANKFVTRDTPKKWEDALDLHDLIIPPMESLSLTEYESKSIDHIFSLTHNTRHSLSTAFNHLSRTFRLIKGWGFDEHTTVAALYHCTLGTNIYNHVCIPISELRSLLTQESVNVIESYRSISGMSDADIETGYMKPEIKQKVLHIVYANAIEQMYRIGEFSKLVISTRNLIHKLGLNRE